MRTIRDTERVVAGMPGRLVPQHLYEEDIPCWQLVVQGPDGPEVFGRDREWVLDGGRFGCIRPYAVVQSVEGASPKTAWSQPVWCEGPKRHAPGSKGDGEFVAGSIFIPYLRDADGRIAVGFMRQFRPLVDPDKDPDAVTYADIVPGRERGSWMLQFPRGFGQLTALPESMGEGDALLPQMEAMTNEYKHIFRVQEPLGRINANSALFIGFIQVIAVKVAPEIFSETFAGWGWRPPAEDPGQLIRAERGFVYLDEVQEVLRGEGVLCGLTLAALSLLGFHVARQRSGHPARPEAPGVAGPEVPDSDPTPFPTLLARLMRMNGLDARSLARALWYDSCRSGALRNDPAARCRQYLLQHFEETADANRNDPAHAARRIQGLADRLFGYMMEQEPYFDPNREERIESMARSVDNWLKGRNAPKGESLRFLARVLCGLDDPFPIEQALNRSIGPGKEKKRKRSVPRQASGTMEPSEPEEGRP